LEAYSKAIELDPSEAEWYNKRGYINDRYFGNYSAALADFNTAIKLAPTDPLYYLNRANLMFYVLNDKKGAFKDYTKAIEVAPTTARYYFERAKRYYLSHNIDAALKDMKAAIKYDPERISYKEILARWSEDHNISPEEIEAEEFSDDNLKENSKSFKNIMQGLKEKIFGKENSSKLYMALPFVPKAVMQLLTNDITLEQLTNRTEVIETAFYKAQKRVPQEIVNTDEKEALNQFLKYFKMELEFAGVDAKKIEKLVNKVKEHIGLSNLESAEYDKALRALQIYENTALAARFTNDYETAIKYYNIMIKYGEDNEAVIKSSDELKTIIENAYFSIATIKYKLKQYKEAIEYLKKAIDYNGGRNESYKQMLELWTQEYSVASENQNNSGTLFAFFLPLPKFIRNWLTEQNNKAKVNSPAEVSQAQELKTPAEETPAVPAKEIVNTEENLRLYNEASQLSPTNASDFSTAVLKKYYLKDSKLAIPLPKDIQMVFVIDMWDLDRILPQKAAYQRAFDKAETETLKVAEGKDTEELVRTFLANLKKELDIVDTEGIYKERIVKATESFIRHHIFHQMLAKKNIEKYKAALEAKNYKLALHYMSFDYPSAEICYDRALLNWYIFGNKEAAIADIKVALLNNPNNSLYKETLEKFTEGQKATDKVLSYEDIANIDTPSQTNSVLKLYFIKDSALPIPLPDKTEKLLGNSKELLKRKEDIQNAFDRAEQKTLQVSEGKNPKEIMNLFLNNFEEEVKLLALGAVAERELLKAMKSFVDFHFEKQREAKDYIEKYKKLLKEKNYNLAAHYILKAHLTYFCAEIAYDDALLNWYEFGNKNRAISEIKLALLNDPDNALYKETLEKWTKELGKSDKEIEKAAKYETFHEYYQVPEYQILDEYRASTQNKNNSGVLMMSLLPIPMAVQKVLTGQIDFNKIASKMQAHRYFKIAEKNKYIDISLALEYYNEAIRLNPNKAEYFFARGYLKDHSLQDYIGALQDYTKAIELDPNNANYYHQRGFLRTYGFKDGEEADKDYDKAISLDTRNHKYYYHKALLNHEILNNSKVAIVNLALAIKYAPRDIKETYKNKFQEWYGQTYDNYMRHTPLFDELYDKNHKKQKKVAKQKTQAKSQTSRTPEVSSFEKVFNKIISKASTPEYYFRRALLKESLIFAYEDALSDYNAAIVLKPENVIYYYRRALLKYYKVDEKESALKDLEKAIEYAKGLNKRRLENIYKKWSKEMALSTEKADGNSFQGLKEKIFGKKSSSSLFLSVLPLPPVLSQVLMGNLTLEQLFNNTPAIRKAFEDAEEATLKHTKVIDSPATISVFLSNLQQELAIANVDNIKTQKLLETTKRYMRGQLPEEVRKEEAEKFASMATLLKLQGVPNEILVQYYDKAIEWDNTNAEYYFYRAYAMTPISLKHAREDFKKALELDPENETYKKFLESLLQFYKDDINFKKSIQNILNSLKHKVSGVISSVKDKKQNLQKHSTAPSKIALAQEYAQKAYEKRLKGYYATALAYYNEAIALDPSKAEYFYERALTKHQNLSDYNGSVEDYIQAMDLDPQNGDFYTENAAKALDEQIIREEEALQYEQSMDFKIKNNDFYGAMQDLEEAIKLNPNKADYYYHRATFKYYLEDYKGAFLNIQKAIDLDKNRGEYYVVRADIKIYFEDFVGAVEDISKAINLDPKNDSLYALRAVVKRILMDYNGVMADYDMAIKLDPKNPEYYILRANLRFSFENYVASLRDYNTAIKLDPENFEYYMMRAGVKSVLNDIKGAEKDFQKAIELDPENPNNYLVRGSFRGSNEDIVGALEDFDKAIELDPENADFYYNRALARSLLEDEGAFEDYDKAVELDPGNSVFYFGRALAFEDEGNYEAALSNLKTAILLDPQEEYLFARASLNLEQKNYKAVITDLDMAIDLSPENAEYYYKRAIAKEKLNDIQGALNDYISAIELDPENEDYHTEFVKFFN
ncbi:MAG: tetratricopeptide repeat protein, partial [Elusimicrobiaceae bacterium]|nr:tetratricopeptide repeat protein [Elusimicrobiaceae bacterium]